MTKLPDTLRQRAIDGLARAMCLRETVGTFPTQERVDQYVNDFWTEWRDDAEHALNTLLSIIVEPDEAMTGAGHAEGAAHVRAHYVPGFPANPVAEFRPWAEVAIWKAMILKLSETGE